MFRMFARAMVLVWLCSYSYPSYRQFVQSKRRLCVFPADSWLPGRLHSAGLDSSRVKQHSMQRPFPLTLRALCRASPGRYEAGVLTPWTAEEQLQLDYLHSPTDGFSFKVEHCWEATFPTDEEAQLWFRRSFRGGEGIAKISHRHPVFVLRAEDIRGVHLRCCSSGRSEGLADVVSHEGFPVLKE